MVLAASVVFWPNGSPFELVLSLPGAGAAGAGAAAGGFAGELGAGVCGDCAKDVPANRVAMRAIAARVIVARVMARRHKRTGIRFSLHARTVPTSAQPQQIPFVAQISPERPNL